ncbi:MAG: UPF0147 family protein [Candidatus Diapherotrites archaeon]|nr:UPF0147 family protein [Candidatus Diapherotrites archaeon]
MEQALENIKYVMDNILGDNSVPRNIKRAVEEAKNHIFQSENNEVGFTRAIYVLDEILNDVNMPFHTRTEIMSIISELERLKEQMK